MNNQELPFVYHTETDAVSLEADEDKCVWIVNPKDGDERVCIVRTGKKLYTFTEYHCDDYMDSTITHLNLRSIDKEEVNQLIGEHIEQLREEYERKVAELQTIQTLFV